MIGLVEFLQRAERLPGEDQNDQEFRAAHMAADQPQRTDPDRDRGAHPGQ